MTQKHTKSQFTSNMSEPGIGFGSNSKTLERQGGGGDPKWGDCSRSWKKTDNLALQMALCAQITIQGGTYWTAMPLWTTVMSTSKTLKTKEKRPTRLHKFAVSPFFTSVLLAFWPPPALPPFLGSHPACHQRLPERLFVSGQLLQAHGPLACCGPASWYSCPAVYRFASISMLQEPRGQSTVNSFMKACKSRWVATGT